VIVAVASGKGGTGKTTVSTNLARALAARTAVRYLDCDVEEPNGHLFLKPSLGPPHTIHRKVPVVDATACTGCGVCSDFCRFGAIAVMPNGPLVFPELCHSCGGCAMLCPSDAITEEDRPIGEVETGRSGDVAFVHGRLRVGEPASPPLIAAVREMIDPDAVNLLDAPPGVACPAVAALRGADFALLVTEPTPFGLHDLAIAAETTRELGVPFAVVVNRSDMGDGRVDDWCKTQGIEVLARFREDRRIAEATSRGDLAYDVLAHVRGGYDELGRLVVERASAARAGAGGR